jgi:hypothetical protein
VKQLLATVLLAIAAGSVAASETPSNTSESAPTDTTVVESAPAIPGADPNAAPSESVSSEAAAPAPGLATPPRREPIRLDPAKPSIAPLAQPRWSDLSTEQRQILAAFGSQWSELPSNEKRAWSDLARRFPQLGPQEQARAQSRISEWAALTPEQRRIARANYRLLQQIGKDNLATEWERYQALTPDQRAILDTAGSTSNTAARHLGAPTGLAKEAAQPLPRRAPPKPVLATDAKGNPTPAGGVTPTVGTTPAAGR